MRKLNPVNLNNSFEESKLSSGDILVIIEESVDIEKHYKQLYDSCHVMMVDLDSLEGPNVDSFVMIFSRHDTISQMYQKVSERLNESEFRLILAQVDDETPIRISGAPGYGTHSIYNMDPLSQNHFFTALNPMYSMRTIYFQLTRNIKKSINITVLDDGRANSVKCLVSDVPACDYLMQHCNIGDRSDSDYSLMLKISRMGHITNILPGSSFLSSIPRDGHTSLYYLLVKRPECGSEQPESPEPLREERTRPMMILYTIKGVPGYVWVHPLETLSVVLKRINNIATSASLYAGDELMLVLDMSADVYELFSSHESDKRCLHLDLNIKSSNAPSGTGGTIRFKK